MNCGKFWKVWEYQATWPAAWETCMQFSKQQLELDKEKLDGETMADFIFGGSKSLQMVTAAMKLKRTPWKESCDQPRQHIKK